MVHINRLLALSMYFLHYIISYIVSKLNQTSRLITSFKQTVKMKWLDHFNFFLSSKLKPRLVLFQTNKPNKYYIRACVGSLKIHNHQS